MCHHQPRPVICASQALLNSHSRHCLIYLEHSGKLLNFKNMAQGSARPQLEDVLECTICLDVPASPIHNCANGHIICGICVDKITKCGQCQDVNFQISIVTERLSRQPLIHSDIECENRNENISDKVKVPLKEYGNHLVEHHECVRSTKFFHVLPYKLYDNLPFHPVMFSQDGNTFLLNGHTDSNQLVYFWVTVLGDIEDAEKYLYQLVISKTIERDRKIKTSTTMPVLAYHDRPKYIPGLPFYVALPAQTLMEFCIPLKAEGYPYEHKFDCEVYLKKDTVPT
ncbi:E3 ubiquitin-protein ligase sina [Folsomia candida]|uniref:E3 ubiquitin-protein ligase sina n=1 Tax=Folsomia candida TaxID=158441 RepID=A0A226DV48_FOLCA|nr:E3 ubiquitin-protein ligase sina [Folsomia candida]